MSVATMTQPCIENEPLLYCWVVCSPVLSIVERRKELVWFGKVPKYNWRIVKLLTSSKASHNNVTV